MFAVSAINCLRPEMRTVEGDMDAAEVGFAVAGVEGKVVDVVYSRSWVGVGAFR